MITIYTNHNIKTPSHVEIINDAYKADYVIQIVQNINDIDSFSEGAFLLIEGLIGCHFDYWQYIISKAKKAFCKDPVPGTYVIKEWTEIWNHVL